MFKIIKKIHNQYAIAKFSKTPLHVSSSNGSKKFTEVEHHNGGIREICLNEPKTHNSLSMDMMDSILESITSDWQNKELRCIVLSAKGNVWSAGHNIKELNSVNTKKQTEIFQKLSDIILSIHKAPVPVIAKVNGLAAAAGCQLVASCDIIVASQKSTFSTPGANFGVFCSTPGIAISRTVSRPKSAYMLMTGLSITAQEAYIAGLISRVVPESELDNEMQKVTGAIESKSRIVISLGKEFYYQQLNLPVKKAYELGCKKMVENLELTDCHEGLKSFMEKRAPKWKHE